MTSIEENAHQYASEKCDCNNCIRECTEEWRKSMTDSCDYYNENVRLYIEIATEQRKIDIDKAKREFCKARCPLQYEQCEKGFWKQGCLAYFNFSRAMEETL